MATRPTIHTVVTLVLLVAGVSLAQQWWVRYRDNSVGAQLAALAKAGDIRMIASDNCAICDVARRWLTEHRVRFTECSIERDTACREAFAASLAPGTPVFEVGGRRLVGFEPALLQQALQTAR
jgi:hypothetical protein